MLRGTGPLELRPRPGLGFLALFPTSGPDPLQPAPALPAADDAAPPRPIGPERLRALREAILNGTYPLNTAVTSGLVKLFREGQPAGAARAKGPGPGHSQG